MILYSCPQGSGNVTVNDTSARSAVITAVKPSDSCHVWMKLCNEPGFCSSISNMCLAPSILKGAYIEMLSVRALGVSSRVSRQAC